jgi:hypothetical protein
MDIWFNPTTQALFLMAADGTPVAYDSWKMIHFGNDSQDINLCNPATFQYHLKKGTQGPDLTQQSTSFTLSNNVIGGPLLDINVNLRLITPTIVNVQWSFASQPGHQRVPFTVPTNIINPQPSLGKSA